ncbi:LCP family protein [Streptomyces sp. NPDC059740]|uniref:LCP family protein n=1 Tax=Streptomyces sp. NPDC059740 TaxID=3346926 RepID=UPI00365B7BB1
MTQWPDGWSPDDRNRYGRGSGAEPEGARAMPHVTRPAGPGAQRSGEPYAEPPLPPSLSPRRHPSVPPQAPPPGYDGGGDGYNTGEVYGGGRGGGGPRSRPNWGRRIKFIVIALIVVVVAASVGTYFWADGKLRREVDLSKVIDRPASGDGTNYLIVGSDSREGMSAAEKKSLHTGSAEGKRTDSMMILHDGSNGPTLVSLPRDSWVTIPSFRGSESGKMYQSPGGSKLNASYATDGPELLTRTIEYNTGLHIDHYVEIGFAGFAGIVDAVGGVEMDIPKAFHDEKSGADFKAGTQTLNGTQALAFVRTRYALPGSDLDRTKNQQKFLGALASQTATPSTVLNPFKLYPTMSAGLDTLVVDKDMSLFDLGKMFFAMKGVMGGDGHSMNMPLTTTPAPQNSLNWDKPKVKELVNELNNDQKVTMKGGYGN